MSFDDAYVFANRLIQYDIRYPKNNLEELPTALKILRGRMIQNIIKRRSV